MMFPNIYPSSAQLQSGTCRSHQISRAVSPGWASLPICGALGQAGTTTEGEQQEIGGFNRQQGQIVANRNQDLRLFGRWRVPETFGFGPSKFRCWFHFDGFGLFPTLGQMLLVGEKNTQQTWQQDDFFGALLGTCTIAPGVELEAMLKTLPAGWSSVVSTWNHPRILQCGPRQIANLLYDKANVDISRARWFHEPASIWSLGAQPHIFSMFAGDSSCQVWSHLFAGSFRRVFTALRQWPVVPGRAQEISTKTGEVVDLYGSIWIYISIHFWGPIMYWIHWILGDGPDGNWRHR